MLGIARKTGTDCHPYECSLPGYFCNRKQYIVTIFVTIVTIIGYGCEFRTKFLYNSTLVRYRTGKIMDKPLGFVYAIILILNLAIVSLFSLVMYQTTFLICDTDQARNFLEQARYLPHIPWHVPVYAISSFFILTLSGIVKRRLNENQSLIIFFLFLLDIAITFFISYNLNFSYKGLFLFLGVGAFFFLSNLPLRYFAISLVMLGYIFSVFYIISVRWNLFSL